MTEEDLIKMQKTAGIFYAGVVYRTFHDAMEDISRLMCSDEIDFDTHQKIDPELHDMIIKLSSMAGEITCKMIDEGQRKIKEEEK